MTDELQQTIDAAWEDRATIGAETKGSIRQAVDRALAMLDSGAARSKADELARFTASLHASGVAL